MQIRREVEGILTIMATTKRKSVHPKNSAEYTPCEDEVLRDLYAERDAYAAEHDFDLDRIYADLKHREETSRLRRADHTPAKI